MISLIVIVILVYISQAAQLLTTDTVVFKPGLRKWRLATPVARFPGLGKLLYLGLLVPPLRGLLVISGRKHEERKSFLLKDIKRRLAYYRVLSPWPRTFANFLFVYLIVIVPVALIRYPITLMWRVLLVELILLQIACAVAYWFCHRRLFPTAKGDRFSHTLTVLLSPLAALRMDDAVLKDLMKGFHPVAVARILLPEAEALRFADRALWRHKHLGHEADEALEQFVRKEFGTRMPERKAQSREAVAYCPLCDAEYTSMEQGCTDCQGPLREFSARS